jgi:hypothetical protein
VRTLHVDSVPHRSNAGEPIPRKADKKNDNKQATTRIRPDAYAELIRLDTKGLETCSGGCKRRWPLGRCEHHEVEHQLGYEVDPAHPSDLAIREALLLIAEQCDYEGADHEQEILKACNAGRISPEMCNRLLEAETDVHERDFEAVAFELLTTRYGWSNIDSAPDRRWRTDLDNEERRQRHRLEELRFSGGFEPEDRAVYQKLTEPAPLERMDWGQLPEGLRDEAERIAQKRKRRARGQLPRSVRVSAIDRRRLPTFEVPSFRDQIGAIATASTPAEIERAVRDYRRAAKRLGLLPPEHDRRRGQRASTE